MFLVRRSQNNWTRRNYKGAISVKVGPSVTNYKGSLQVVRLDPKAREIEILGKGQDVRGKGSASMKLTGAIHALADGSTEVKSVSELNVVGMLAQLGSRVISEVSNVLFQQFVANLQKQLEGSGETAEAPATAAPISALIWLLRPLKDCSDAEGMPAESAASLVESFEKLGYVMDRSLATVMFLVMRLRKPLLLEGHAGLGKTEAAKVLAELLGTRLIRLQCHEGLDVSSAVYEWNYQKQLLAIQIQQTQEKTAAEKEKYFLALSFYWSVPCSRPFPPKTPRRCCWWMRSTARMKRLRRSCSNCWRTFRSVFRRWAPSGRSIRPT